MKKGMMRTLFSIVCLWALTGLLKADTAVVGFTTDVTTLTGQGSVQSDSITVTVNFLGEIIEVGVYAETVTPQIWFYSFDVVYDESVLDLVDSPQEQWFFEKGLGDPDSSVFLFSDRNGVVSVAASVKDTGITSGLSGEGLMATFKFKTLKSASTNLQIQNFFVTFIDPITGPDTVPEQGAILNLTQLVLAQAQNSLKNFTVYPNPYRPNDGNSNTGKPFSSGDPQSGIIFANISNPVNIKIFTLNGELVKEKDITDGSSQWNWDARNAKGREIASGLYIYVVTAGNGEKKTGKLMVIR